MTVNNYNFDFTVLFVVMHTFILDITARESITNQSIDPQSIDPLTLTLSFDLSGKK